MPAKLTTPEAIEFRNLLNTAGEALLPGENGRGRNGKGAERRCMVVRALHHHTGDTIPLETLRRWGKGYNLPERRGSIIRALRAIIDEQQCR